MKKESTRHVVCFGSFWFAPLFSKQTATTAQQLSTVQVISWKKELVNLLRWSSKTAIKESLMKHIFT